MRIPKKITTSERPPQTDNDINFLILEIGGLDTSIRQIEAEFDKETNRIKRQFNKQLRPLTQRLLLLATFVFNYMETHKDRLTRDAGSKTIRMSSGTFSWRLNKPSLKFKSEKRLVKYLKKNELARFVRTKETVKKKELLDYLIKKALTIRDVEIAQEEEAAIRAEQMSEDYKLKRSKLPQLEFSFTTTT